MTSTQQSAATMADAEAIIVRPDFLFARAHRIGGSWAVQLVVRDSDSPSGKRGVGPLFDDTAELTALLQKHGRTSPLSPSEGL